jgi:hypothetical protein
MDPEVEPGESGEPDESTNDEVGAEATDHESDFK